MTTTTKNKPKSKTTSKKRPTRSSAKAKAKPVAKSGKSKPRATSKPAAATVQPVAPTKASKMRTRRPRIALADKAHTAEITKAVGDLPTSKDHICWKRNGKICELYFRIDGKTPILFCAPDTSPVDENGYRIKDAVSTVTGVFHIKQSIKKLTGKTPSALGISLPRDPADVAADKCNGKTAASSKPKPRKKREGLSGLDAAAQVLAKAKEPMNAKTICEQAIALGWKTSGQTPHATLYAAMIREIAAKGDESRFSKVDKGLFTANGKAV